MRPDVTRGWLCLLWVLCCACGPGLQSHPAPVEEPDAGSPPAEVELPFVTLGEVVVSDVEGSEMSMQVLGVGFARFSDVFLNDQRLTTQFVSATELRAVVPSSFVTGATDLFFEVRVARGDPEYGEGARSARIPFTVPAPELTSVTPDSLPSEPEDAVQITVTGKNLVHGSQAIFRGTSYPLTLTSSREGSFLLPPSALKPLATQDPLVIQVSRPRTATTQPLPLTVTSPTPEITGVWPPSLNATDLHHGNAGSATFERIIVSGRQVRSTTVVKWDGIPLPTETYDGKNRVWAQIPLMGRVQAGTVQVTLETPGVHGGRESSSHGLRVKSEPVLHDVSPAWVLTGSEEVRFKLKGEGLGLYTQPVVHWNGHPLEHSFGPDFQGVLTFIVPAALLTQAGTLPVTVTRTFDGAVSAPLFVQVFAQAPAPIAHSLLPSVLSVDDAPGLLYVEGAGFTPQSVILLDGQERTTRLHDPSRVSIELQAADLSTKGVRTVTVSTPAPGGGTTLPLLLAVHAERPMPIINQVSGNNGYPHALAGGGVLRLLVEGQGFGPSSVVRWNGQPLPAQWACWTSGGCTAGPGDRARLWVNVPADLVAQPGVGRVTVFNPGPGGGESPEQFFVLIAAGQPTVYLVPSVVDVGASDASDREVTVLMNVMGPLTQASVLFMNDMVRAFDSPSGLRLSDEEVATPRVHKLQIFTVGSGLSAPAYLRVQGALPPQLRATTPGVVSQGEWAASEERRFFLWGENFFWPSSNFQRVSGTTLDWDDQSQPFVRPPSQGLEGTKLEHVGVRSLKVSRVAEGGGASLPALLNVVSERPVPMLTAVEPMSALKGAPALTLRIKGKGIHSATVLRWKEFRSSLKAVYVLDNEPTHYEATLPAEALATAGGVDVTLETPEPGGGVSLPLHVIVEE
ncbi:hypothetical protein FJV41_04370 [Myxococcus llanfairpwllgwyngyllgogerychwyrndrobwllllantysiliogogogochensis]|uniref:IPT/TIG domain-containing protein n=1 Tax=Myxococcus llanfairpwllgwyngyllgogerychwyrndrobwllllantysiliogogogochensis TaxID=2590453 RepID=A0A540X7B2_9BACT|nr:hypothetical protein [Myxococcus llanfairpwllgwyngyllgogerychwyrndrobwllllantysiliogogogochensis]TQF17171.1 hypothetical protein FJV41_04370 [Myxococcus llanfairpwllgwyngyllgogerychwyrndrobwllllantysiliogogogochensis]